jgi:hypothetical protein
MQSKKQQQQQKKSNGEVRSGMKGIGGVLEKRGPQLTSISVESFRNS